VVAQNVLQELATLAPVEAVRGNMDEPSLQESLQERLVVEVEDVRIGLVHVPGPVAGRAERLIAWFPGCAAVVYGHTHAPQRERFGGVWILNPGSPTERRRAPARSMLTLDVEGSRIRPRLVTFGST
jgi:putative phosphoesterase